jgi:small conductance mechanosensitive channel
MAAGSGLRRACGATSRAGLRRFVPHPNPVPVGELEPVGPMQPVAFSRLVHLLACAVLAAAAVAWPARAVLPAPASEEATSPEAEAGAGSAIADEAAPGSDQRITARVRGIFSQIPALERVEVTTSAGVVRLTGTVPAAGDIDRAEAIAGRISGVVTVENELTRDLAVDSNLEPALGSFGDRVQNMIRAAPLFGVAVGLAIAIGAFGYLLAARKRWWLAIAPNAFLAELVATSIRFVFVLLGLVAALELLGATALLGAVLGGAGVLGIALGFAVRDTIDNYVSSLMLSLRQPFRANDHVVIEGQEGRVVRLTSRATILMTLDGNHLRIPNATVFKAVILNYTRNPERRFSFELGIDADDDPVDGMAVGLKAVNALDFVLDEPPATAIIKDVGDSNIVLCFFGWVNQERTDFRKGRSLAIQAAKHALEEAGFALPEPIYRLRFDEAAPLPTQRQAPERRERKPPRPVPDSSATDVAPDEHVEKLVREERSVTADEDLLDSNRPVE